MSIDPDAPQPPTPPAADAIEWLQAREAAMREVLEFISKDYEGRSLTTCEHGRQNRILKVLTSDAGSTHISRESVKPLVEAAKRFARASFDELFGAGGVGTEQVAQFQSDIADALKLTRELELEDKA